MTTVANTFMPPGWVEALHNMPRVFGDSSFSTGKEYVHNVIISIVVWCCTSLLLIAAVTLLWFCCKKKRGRDFRPKKPLTKWHLVALLVLLVPVLVSAIALFIGTSNLASGLTEVSRDLKVLAAAAGDAGDHVVEIMAGANGVSSEITSVVDQCQGEGTPDSIKSVSGFLDEMTKATNTVNTTMSKVEGTVVKLSHTAEDIKLLASIAQYTIASLALLVVIVLPVSCWLAGKWLPGGGRRGRCISKFGCYVVVPLTLVVGSVLVLYTVTAFAINVAIADACVLPDQKIPAFILESDFLYSAFSSACDGPIQSIIQKITGVLGSIMGVVNVAAGIGSFIAGFFKVCGDGSKDWGDVIKSVNSDLQALVKSVDGLSESTFCLGLQALYSNDIYQSLCHKTGTSLLVCWISTVIGGVFLLVIAFGLIFFFNVFLEPEAARSGASASDAGLAGTVGSDIDWPMDDKKSKSPLYQ